LIRSYKDLCDSYRLNENDPTLQQTQWSFSIALRQYDGNLARFREYFMVERVVLWSSVKLSRQQLCLLALFSVKIDFDLN